MVSKKPNKLSHEIWATAFTDIPNKTKNKYINSVFWDIKYKIPLCLDINSFYVITSTNEKIKLN